MVLTSKKSYFVDIRILKDKLLEEGNKETQTLACLEWAFAGVSYTLPLEVPDARPPNAYHSVWEHWLDSKSDNPNTDEGDMTPLADGTTLEEGFNTDPVTGSVSPYEELWRDLPLERSVHALPLLCIVAYAEGTADSMAGMVVRIGAWCQGMIKSRDGMTVERWQVGPTKDLEQDVKHDDSAKTQDVVREDWKRLFKIGSQELPCQEMCKASQLSDIADSIMYGEVRWDIIEKSSM